MPAAAEAAEPTEQRRDGVAEAYEIRQTMTKDGKRLLKHPKVVEKWRPHAAQPIIGPRHLEKIDEGLGQHVDVSRVHSESIVVFSPVASRCTSILRRLRLCRERNHLPAGEAGSIRGKLGWVLSAAYARVGRAASQPLTERAVQEGRAGGTDEWTPALEHMLEFYEVLLAVDARGVPRLPPLEVACRRHERAPVVVYSDAMFRRLAGGAPYGRVAFVVFVAGRRPVVARALVPAWVYNFLSADSFTLIQQLEIAAAVGAYRSCPELLRKEAVIHFIDNTGALSNLIHGYASRPDCGRLVNALHLTLASLRTQAWFEWVPSKENIADVPSREDSDLELIEILEGAGLEGAFDEVEFLFPPMQAWTAPLGIFAAAP